ncbi:metalloregulator ArsR/SmtB family transcription factor [Thalassotalea sp. HSM 43]|uniref:metalloregulator ArsR/SmtB family transcription factor n=1 Tax=Thalassotalea sp. HSM 43 TaxID=2552945 RepID=UPI00108109A7|nr:metalloregulator ArsR/SmtB family transcription factor [Thalassotalea sp. HSM 43]QBY04289.1 metalloregulator ArsR/SmtB family transcription factor [Thalassotalea sp. HSM 43]
MLTAVEFYKALADDTRLQTLLLVVAEQELCVCELVEALQCSQPKISRHLALLKQQNLLVDRKQKQWVFYRLNPALPQWCQHVLETSLQHNQNYLSDAAQRLSLMQNRPDKCC